MGAVKVVIKISIHALRVEGDLVRSRRASRGNRISIHALRVEGDRGENAYLHRHCRFLSTPSGWRATSRESGSRESSRISIHALRVEGDLITYR